MGIDPKIEEAIRTAVRDAGQPATLARRLVAWFDAVTSGNEDISDLASVERRLDVLYAETVVNQSKGEAS